MNLSKSKLISVAFSLLLILSATSAGFLVGRTAKVKAAMDEQTITQVQEQVAATGTIIEKGAAIIRRVILK